MAENSKIAWTHHTFNPWHGCVKVSPGCKNCYAESLSKRYGFDIWGVDAPRRFLSADNWKAPHKWNKWAVEGTCYSCGGKGWQGKGIPCVTCSGLGNIGPYRPRVFCASMADVFETHRNQEIQAQLNRARNALAELVLETPDMDWLFLTKRISDVNFYLQFMFPIGLPGNLWLGTSAENQEQYNKRAPYLNLFDVTTFISVEPQLEKIELSENMSAVGAIDLVIVGGESGPGCRPFNPDWARSLRDECRDAGIAFFMKQLGGHPNKREKLSDLPEDLRIREVPDA